MAEIIKLTKESQLKTRIMYSANLSFSQLNHYLSFLTEKGFIRVRVEKGKKRFEATNKGKKFIENYVEMSNLLKLREPIEKVTLVR
jgi:predicted transcriptional regulator